MLLLLYVAVVDPPACAPRGGRGMGIGLGL